MSTPDDLDSSFYAADRLGLGAEMQGNESYSMFCWKTPLMVPTDELRRLWDAMSHLSPDDISETFSTYLIGKAGERAGVIEMLEARVPVQYMVAAAVDPRLERNTGHPDWPVRGWREVIDLWEARVPQTYVEALTNYLNHLGTVVPPAGLIALSEAGTEVGYAIACLRAGVQAEEVARRWLANIPLEYASI